MLLILPYSARKYVVMHAVSESMLWHIYKYDVVVRGCTVFTQLGTQLSPENIHRI